MPDMMEELYDVTVEALETTNKDRKSRERDRAQEMVLREKRAGFLAERGRGKKNLKTQGEPMYKNPKLFAKPIYTDLIMQS